MIFLILGKVIVVPVKELKTIAKNFMHPGNFDLLILILVFIGLQLWWIIPLIRNNNTSYERAEELREEIRKLEKLYKK